MKIYDLSSGVRTPITNEESMLIDKIDQGDAPMRRKSLDDREKLVANQLVNKGILTRTRVDGKIYYAIDDSHNIWRI